MNFQDDEKYKLTFDSYSGIIDWDGLSRPWAGDRKRAWDGSNNWRKTLPDMAGHYHHISATNKNCGAGVSYVLYLFQLMELLSMHIYIINIQQQLVEVMEKKLKLI